MKKSKCKVWAILFFIYLAILFRITVFRSRSYPVEFAVNLSLFTDLAATYHENGIWMVLYLVIGNIIWFVPFGILLPMVCRILKGKAVISLGFCLSLIIEVGQLITGKGMFEIDDLVLNTLGAAIGYLIYKIYRDFRK